jgi:hypothetical protein
MIFFSGFLASSILCGDSFCMGVEYMVKRRTFFGRLQIQYLIFKFQAHTEKSA